MIRRVLLVVAVVAAVSPGGPAVAAGEAIVPGEIRVDATFEHLGVVWFVTGDADLDSTMTLEFRPLGATTWRAGAPAIRAYPWLYVHDGPLGIDSWGASALFLEPGTTYELRLTLTDPDGGGTTRTVVAATRPEPDLDPTGTLRYVVPGTGGGRGTEADPFRGLQAAADAARPGDVFLLAPGTYAPFQITTSGTPGRPIVFDGRG
ncbi:MAG TPA: hypothetical protein ENK55_11010, partial [Actinobacteria bacterium]|nr:hypothetical protein [Actinomycetota bacterium]